MEEYGPMMKYPTTTKGVMENDPGEWSDVEDRCDGDTRIGFGEPKECGLITCNIYLAYIYDL